MNKRLRRALQSWPNWDLPLSSRPEIVQLLQGGLTNNSFLLAAADRQLVLRLNAENSAELGIDRNLEAAILTVVSGAGIAPKVHYCSPEEGVLVTEFIPGRPLDITHPDTIGRVQSLFDRVHALQPAIPAFDYVLHVKNYLQLLGLQESFSRLEPDLERLQVASGKSLCHHDPSAGNFVDSNGKLYLLDWEYSGLGAPEFDRAAIRAEWSASCVTFGSSDALAFSAERVYRTICSLWQSLNRPVSG